MIENITETKKVENENEKSKRKKYQCEMREDCMSDEGRQRNERKQRKRKK